jgi:hypothetical protein
VVGNPGSFDVATRLDNVRSLAADRVPAATATSAVSSCPLSPAGWDALGRRPAAGALRAWPRRSPPMSRPRRRRWPTAWRAGRRRLRHPRWPGPGTAAARRSPTERDAAEHDQRRALLPRQDGQGHEARRVGGHRDQRVRHRRGAVPARGRAPLRRRHATLSVRANLAGLRAAFTGTIDGADGLGFDDYLIAVPAPPTWPTRLTGNLDLAIALRRRAARRASSPRWPAIAPPWSRCTPRPSAITDDLKSAVPHGAWGLEIPDDVAGDND